MIDEKKLIEVLEDYKNDEWNKTLYTLLPSVVDDCIDFAENQPKIDEWIPCSERLPTKEEYLRNDGRFICDDGNRRYQGLFDIYDKKFKFSKHVSGLKYELIEDKCVIAWQNLPEPYNQHQNSKRK